MLDQGHITQLQRTRGRAMARLAGGALRDLHQSGSAKAMLPRVHGAVPEVVFLNTAGGLTGGDKLRFEFSVDDGRALGTTQTAERAYQSAGGAARVEVAISVGPGARVEWVPQETILFEGSALDRETRIDLGAGAEALAVEMLVLGRAAMGEEIGALWLRDRREIWRAGRPVLIEPVEIGAEALARRGGGAVLHGARAMGSLAFVAEGAEDALGPVRAALAACDGIEAAASAWDGRLTARILAPDAYEMRRAMARVIEILRRGALPRVWQI